jgi:hypothetical protein
MDNHYHLLLELRDRHLSRAMQWLNLSYTAWFNFRHDRSGHLFQGRFKSVLFDDRSAGLELSRYVHLNPVRMAALKADKGHRAGARQGLGPPPDRAIVAARLERLRQYRWSSYRAFIGASACPPWLSTALVSRLKGPSAEEQRQQYRRYVEEAAREGTDTTGVWKELKEGALLGGARFLARVRRYAKGDRQEQRAAQRLQANRCAWPEVIAAAEKVQGAPWLQWRDRYGDRMRDLVMYLGRRQGGLMLKELAIKCGLRNYATVAMALKRYAARLNREPAERQRLETVAKMLNVKM